MRKIISGILSVIFLLLITSFVIQAAELQWPPWKTYPKSQNYSDKLRVRFRPVDNYTCEQNPPDFSWWKIESAETYDLKVTRDRELEDIVEIREGLTTCYYNFSDPFEPGIYYWSVRFHNAAGDTSVWQPARRFLIEDDAFLFPVEENSGIFAELEERGHPRYYASADNISTVRNEALNGTGRELYDSILATANAAKIADPLKTYLTYDENAGIAMHNPFWKELYAGFDRVNSASFVYLISEDPEMGAYAVSELIEMTKFEMPPMDAITDTYLCIYAMNMAIYYDTIYNLLDEEQKNLVLDAIEDAINKVQKLFDTDKFFANPQSSHEWNCGRYLVVASMLTLGELERSEWVSEYLLSYYVNQTTPHQIEDGGHKGGIGYFRYGATALEHFLERAGVIRLWDKAYYQNQLYFHLYMYPSGSVGAFGDDSYYPVSAYSANIYNRLLNAHKNPIAKWALTQIGAPPESIVDTFYFDDNSNIPPMAPVNLPKSKYFKDIGFAGLHSDLVKRDRISMFFRSSWYGTYAHSHNDNNAFVIQAYGYRLAIDSGYYPYFDSPHHANYSRKTYAHNAITFDDGRGQPTGDIEAEGKITGFLTHSDFDYVGGDATKAYKDDKGGEFPNTLARAKRHILYLRPGAFVVIDDLKALDSDNVSFEYWLQSENAIENYTDDTAIIQNGKAVLDAKVQYPAEVTSQYIDGFKGPDGIEYTKEKDGDTNNTLDTDAAVHKRIVFKTPRVNETRIITTLDVHKDTENSLEINRAEFEHYVRLDFEDGTSVYVNKDGSNVIDTGAIQFSGEAVVINEDSFMLAEGTELIIDNIKRISSDVPVSVVLGKGEMSISSMESDANLSIFYPGISNVVNIKDEKIRPVPENSFKNGIKWTENGDYAEFELYNGQYLMKLDGNPTGVHLTTSDKTFRESVQTSISFGKFIAPIGSELMEYGMICHPTNPLPSFALDGIQKFIGDGLNNRGQFGIRLDVGDNTLGDKYYMRAYAIFKKDGVNMAPIYSQESVLVDNSN